MDIFPHTIMDIAHLLQPQEDAIRQKFIPALTGRNGVSDAGRDLLSLTVRLGGLGLTNPGEVCSHDFTSSVNVTAPLQLSSYYNNLTSPQSHCEWKLKSHFNASWTQASLPVRIGGLGFRSAAQLAPSAFLASAVGSSNLICHIHPSISGASHFQIWICSHPVVLHVVTNTLPVRVLHRIARRHGTLSEYL